MSVRSFRASALTPVHVGTGETIAPEDYLIRENRLVRFNAHAVLRDLGDQERRRYESLVDGNNLTEALRLLRGKAADGRYHLYEAAVGSGARHDLEQAVNNPNRRGEVHLMQRNPHTGEVLIPGSSIKGAIRTALVNAFAHDGERVRPEVREAVEEMKRRQRNRAHEVLEEEAFRYQRRRTERDPMRLVKVSDATAEAGAARVDKVTLHSRSGRDAPRRPGILMHFERLLARADGGIAPEFRVEIGLDEQVQEHQAASGWIKAKLSWDFILQACNYFYWRRLQAELDHFEEARQWYGRFAQYRADCILLRVGRFSHFESLSVDDLREGYNIRTHLPIEGMGSSRTLCELARGGLAPFGWLWLEPWN